MVKLCGIVFWLSCLQVFYATNLALCKLSCSTTTPGLVWDCVEKGMGH